MSAPSRPNDALRAALDARRGEIQAFAEALIRIPSENPPGACYDECVDVIITELRKLGLAYATVAAPGSTGRPGARSVIATWGTAGRVLYFHGHYDVVPAQRPDQFEPRVIQGHLYGRGSSDMKGGLAAMTYAVRALADCRLQPDGEVVLVFVPDEETAGSRGTSHLCARGLLARDAVGMLTPEPTGGVVWHANRGAISWRISVHGKSAHVGLSHLGRNAFTDLLTVANEFAALERRVRVRRTAQAVDPPEALASILLLGGESAGSANFNVVPPFASFTIDRRLNPEEDFESERRVLLEIIDCARAGGVDVRVEVLQEGRASASPCDGPLSGALEASAREALGQAPAFAMCPGLLETRYYAGLGVPAFAYGPGLLEVSHGPQENVPVQRLIDYAFVYALTAMRTLS